MKKPRILILITCLVSLHAMVQGAESLYFDFDEANERAYIYITQLKFEKAADLLDSIQQNNPQNLIPVFLSNYIDCLTIFVGEDEAQYKSLLAKKDYRLRLIQEGDKSSPYYLYTQAEIRLQWAAAKLKFGDYFSAFQEVNRANKLLVRNQLEHPDFVLNKKSLGLLHALIGTVPDTYKWGIKLVSSLDGSINQGRTELMEALRYCETDNNVFLLEARIFYSYAQLHIFNQPEEAWVTASTMFHDAQESALVRFVLANVALSTGRNDLAIKILENQNDGNGSFPFYYLDFMKGLAKLYRLDTDADVHIEYYVNHFRGKNFIKEAYQKLAWFQLIYGTEEGYRNYMKLAISEGNDEVGEDQVALKEAISGHVPNRDLLRCRLLFDGGYFEEAAKEISACDSSAIDQGNWSLEYHYRKGRIHQKLIDFPSAKIHFLQALEAKDEQSYYSCAAGLQLGLIHEEEGSQKKAQRYYRRCLAIKSEEHRTSLHRQAKSGIKRIEERNSY